MRMILDIIYGKIHYFYEHGRNMLATSDLKPGSRVRLIDYGPTDTAYRRKLLSLGITRGVEVNVIRKAPLGCPLQVEVRGSSIALRLNEASHLRWELV